MKSRQFDDVDYEGLANELKALRADVDSQLGDADLRHLRKIELWGQLCSLFGYATAWLFPNPLSALLISQGMITRWTMMMHHVGHRGYDKVPGVPQRYRSKVFARGWRRFIDFPDWIEPESWRHEHNVLHHYHTGEEADPDLVDRNVMALRVLRIRPSIKYVVVAFLAVTWKYLYYAGSTLRAQKISRERPADVPLPQHMGDALRSHFSPVGEDRRIKVSRLYRPYADVGTAVLTKSVIPYVLYRFIAIPALFLLISPQAALYVLLTSLMAEVITNLHAFAIIVPNHCGDDLYKFQGPVTDKAEFYVRQIAGSVNYKTGSDFNDFMHGFLNYQIEHHVWPDLPMLRYQQLQPKVQALCAKYGVPYVQEGLLTRVHKLARIMVGASSMPVATTVPRSKRKPDSAPSTSSSAPVMADAEVAAPA